MKEIKHFPGPYSYGCQCESCLSTLYTFKEDGPKRDNQKFLLEIFRKSLKTDPIKIPPLNFIPCREAFRNSILNP